MIVSELMMNCTLHRLEQIADERGRLIALEGARDVPFEIARIYYLYGTAPGQARGFHAHKTLHQWAICVAGSCTIVADDGTQRVDISLDSPDLALHIGPMVWREMRDFSDGAVLMVLASSGYDERDYIRDYEAFLASARAGSNE